MSKEDNKKRKRSYRPALGLAGGVGAGLLSQLGNHAYATEGLPYVAPPAPAGSTINAELAEDARAAGIRVVTNNKDLPADYPPVHPRNPAYFVPANNGRPPTIAAMPTGSPGVMAHELGHSRHPAWMTSAPANLAAAMIVPGSTLGTIWAAVDDKRRRARLAAMIGSAAGIPSIARELDASWRGSKLLRSHGHGTLDSLRTFAGVPTYMAISAMPLAAYWVKKQLGGYRADPKEKKRDEMKDADKQGMDRTFRDFLIEGALSGGGTIVGGTIGQGLAPKHPFLGSLAGGTIGGTAGMAAAYINQKNPRLWKNLWPDDEDEEDAPRMKKSTDQYDTFAAGFVGRLAAAGWQPAQIKTAIDKLATQFDDTTVAELNSELDKQAGLLSPLVAGAKALAKPALTWLGKNVAKPVASAGLAIERKLPSVLTKAAPRVVPGAAPAGSKGLRAASMIPHAAIDPAAARAPSAVSLFANPGKSIARTVAARTPMAATMTGVDYSLGGYDENGEQLGYLDPTRLRNAALSGAAMYHPATWRASMGRAAGQLIGKGTDAVGITQDGVGQTMGGHIGMAAGFAPSLLRGASTAANKVAPRLGKGIASTAARLERPIGAAEGLGNRAYLPLAVGLPLASANARGAVRGAAEWAYPELKQAPVMMAKAQKTMDDANVMMDKARPLLDEMDTTPFNEHERITQLTQDTTPEGQVALQQAMTAAGVNTPAELVQQSQARLDAHKQARPLSGVVHHGTRAAKTGTIVTKINNGHYKTTEGAAELKALADQHGMTPEDFTAAVQHQHAEDTAAMLATVQSTGLVDKVGGQMIADAIKDPEVQAQIGDQIAKQFGFEGGIDQAKATIKSMMGGGMGGMAAVAGPAMQWLGGLADSFLGMFGQQGVALASGMSLPGKLMTILGGVLAGGGLLGGSGMMGIIGAIMAGVGMLGGPLLEMIGMGPTQAKNPLADPNAAAGGTGPTTPPAAPTTPPAAPPTPPAPPTPQPPPASAGQ